MTNRIGESASPLRPIDLSHFDALAASPLSSLSSLPKPTPHRPALPGPALGASSTQLDPTFLENLRAGLVRSPGMHVASVGPVAHVAPGEQASSNVRAKLDAFRDRASGPFTVLGESVSARPMFRMNGGINQKGAEAHALELSVLCAHAHIPPRDLGLVRIGRGSPEALVRVTQALIDAGKLPDGRAPLEQRIRTMQWTWGIGMDCAGYAAHAAIAVHGSARAGALRNDMTDPFDAMARGQLAFDRVELVRVRAGDLIHLNPPARGDVGHNVIVAAHDVMDAHACERASRTDATAQLFFRGAGPFHRLDVDSSWGAGDGEDFGGYRRDSWYFDAASKTWAYADRATGETCLSKRGPCDEPYAGAFRPKGVTE